MSAPHRVALYYAPAADDPLHVAGVAWLGGDPAGGAVPPQPDLPGIAAITAAARLYGFHATLKPPMRLRTGIGWEAFLARAKALAAQLVPFDLPALSVTDLAGFLALCPATPNTALQALADACVGTLDDCRALPSDEELARRRAGGLSAAREAMLQRWGYPDVFATWRFHMTLTRRLDAHERSLYRPAAEAHFAAALAEPRRVTDICVFVQAAPEAAFHLAARLPFGSTSVSVQPAREISPPTAR